MSEPENVVRYCALGGDGVSLDWTHPVVNRACPCGSGVVHGRIQVPSNTSCIACGTPIAAWIEGDR